MNKTVEIFPGITMNPQVFAGKACIRGMRIRVADVLSWLAAGMTRDEILADYPELTDDDITAALAYAARATEARLAFSPDYAP